jgi:hypothetical protein
MTDIGASDNFLFVGKQHFVSMYFFAYFLTNMRYNVKFKAFLDVWYTIDY